MMDVFLIHVVLSLALLASTWGLSRSRWGISGACWVSGSAMLLFFWLWSPALMLQAFATCLAGLICLALGGQSRAMLVSGSVALIGSYAIALTPPILELNRLAELRRQYPFESVADRLSYETARAAVPLSADEDRSPVQLGSEVENRLIAFEQRRGTRARDFQLSRLHSRTHAEFVLARGFGPVRMRGISRRSLMLPESEPVRLDAPRTIESPYPTDENPADFGNGHAPVDLPVYESSTPSSDALLELHTSGQNDFLNPDRIGYVKDDAFVAGFQSHRMQQFPELASDSENSADWQLTTVELIGLLKHESPVAYVSDHLPSMEKLRDAPTRRLDNFELHALNRLRHDEDLVIDEQADRIRMVGSIRAGNDCRKCHSVRRGELLGAFSYELHRAKPLQSQHRRKPSLGSRS